MKDAALALFWSFGYERTSIEGIAERARLATGSFYQHYRSKRQLLLVLMDDLLAAMAGLKLQPTPGADVRTSLREILASGFSADRRYLGAYRAWREAALADSQMARSEMEIRRWTTQRVAALLTALQKWSGARQGVNVSALALAINNLCWSLLEQPAYLTREGLNAQIDAATHLIYHAIFLDAAGEKFPSGR